MTPSILQFLVPPAFAGDDPVPVAPDFQPVVVPEQQDDIPGSDPFALSQYVDFGRFLLSDNPTSGEAKYWKLWARVRLGTLAWGTRWAQETNAGGRIKSDSVTMSRVKYGRMGTFGGVSAIDAYINQVQYDATPDTPANASSRAYLEADRNASLWHVANYIIAGVADAGDSRFRARLKSLNGQGELLDNLLRSPALKWADRFALGYNISGTAANIYQIYARARSLKDEWDKPEEQRSYEQLVDNSRVIGDRVVASSSQGARVQAYLAIRKLIGDKVSYDILRYGYVKLDTIKAKISTFTTADLRALGIEVVESATEDYEDAAERLEANTSAARVKQVSDRLQVLGEDAIKNSSLTYYAVRATMVFYALSNITPAIKLYEAAQNGDQRGEWFYGQTIAASFFAAANTWFSPQGGARAVWPWVGELRYSLLATVPVIGRKILITPFSASTLACLAFMASSIFSDQVQKTASQGGVALNEDGSIDVVAQAEMMESAQRTHDAMAMNMNFFALDAARLAGIGRMATLAEFAPWGLTVGLTHFVVGDTFGEEGSIKQMVSNSVLGTMSYFGLVRPVGSFAYSAVSGVVMDLAAMAIQASPALQTAVAVAEAASATAAEVGVAALEIGANVFSKIALPIAVAVVAVQAGTCLYYWQDAVAEEKYQSTAALNAAIDARARIALRAAGGDPAELRAAVVTQLSKENQHDALITYYGHSEGDIAAKFVSYYGQTVEDYNRQQKSVRDGTNTPEEFNTWFANDFVPFVELDLEMGFGADVISDELNAMYVDLLLRDLPNLTAEQSAALAALKQKQHSPQVVASL